MHNQKIPKKFSLMTGMFWKHEINDIIEKIIDSGFQTIEIWGDSKHFPYTDKTKIDNLKKILDNNNIKICALHMPSKPPFAFDTVNETENLLAVEQLCQITEIMHYLEIPMLLIHPGNELSDNIFQQKSTALKHLSYLCGYLKKGNLILSIENPLPHHLGGRFEEFSFFMDKLKYDNVGWCIDTSHLLLSNETEKFLEKYTDRIIHTHLSDNLGKFDDHVIPSEGIVDWKKIYSILTKDSYTGKINFEILNSFSEDYKNGISLTEKLKKYIIETFPDLK